MTTLSSFLASFTYTSVQEADRRLIWNFAFVSEPHWSFIKLWLLLCLENAFSKAAQKWQSVMINIKQCEHFYLLQRLQREGMLVRSLLAPPLSSHVCLAFCSCSLMWWGGLCGLGHSRPAAWSLSALTTADDCAQRFGHLFQLAGGWGFWLPSWGSRTMLILEIKSSVNETVIASFESISFAVFLILYFCLLHLNSLPVFRWSSVDHPCWISATSLRRSRTLWMLFCFDCFCTGVCVCVTIYPVCTVFAKLLVSCRCGDWLSTMRLFRKHSGFICTL